MELNEKTTRISLTISLWLKGFLAFTEIAGGLIFFFLSQNSIIQFVYKITQTELSEDPNDFISRQLILFSHNLFPGLKYFIVIYLLLHGVVKMIVIIALLKNKLWSYPAGIIVFIFFIIYQLYRFCFTHSIFLILLTVLDAIVLWLVWREYKFVKNGKYEVKKI